MSMVKIEKKVSKHCLDSEAHYPYGTSLRFEDELVDQLQASQLAVGDMVEIKAYAVVEAKSERSEEHKDSYVSSKEVCLQLTDVKVSRHEETDRTKVLYG